MRLVSALFLAVILIVLPASAQLRPYGPNGPFPRVPNPQPVPGSALNGVPGIRSGVYVNGLPAFSTKYPCPGCSPFQNRRIPQRSYVYPSFGYLGYVPLFDSFDSNPTANAPAAATPSDDAKSLAMAEQIGELRGEIKQLRSQTAAAGSSHPSAAAGGQVSVPQVQPEPVAQRPPTVIVLHNGTQIETANYAVMNQTLWNFSSTPVQKIPLSSIDVEASQKASAQRGSELALDVSDQQ